MKICINGASPAIYALALQLREHGADVLIAESVSRGFARKAPLARRHWERLARQAGLAPLEFFERAQGHAVRVLSLGGRPARPFADVQTAWVCEESLARILREEAVRRAIPIVAAPERFNGRRAALAFPAVLSLPNPRGALFRDPTVSPDVERRDRVHAKTYVFPLLTGWEDQLELHVRPGLVLIAEAGRLGTHVFVEAATAAHLVELERQLAWPRAKAATDRFGKLVEKLRPHWLATHGSRDHQAQALSVGVFARDTPLIGSWGWAIGTLPPLFNLELELELRQATTIARFVAGRGELDRSDLLKLQVALRYEYQEMARLARAWRFALTDPLFGRGVAFALGFTPGVTREWIRLPF